MAPRPLPLIAAREGNNGRRSLKGARLRMSAGSLQKASTSSTLRLGDLLQRSCSDLRGKKEKCPDSSITKDKKKKKELIV